MPIYIYFPYEFPSHMNTGLGHDWLWLTEKHQMWYKTLKMAWT